ncbi:MAG TPA: MBL fold metallo-hydrolase [Thermodesulfobacteriota bacterium]|nr:MBL fold metallo-hydrolase [Deltaproteobacteria bacterium]HNU70291.1 MBL fold metallo-hydrolase [Thermodesulfobacteriota bacterium]HOC39030.1 MBL fold metallo-hydrolase [Thermodesulfobacteriota bacterium]
MPMLRETERVEIITIIDNYCNVLLPSDERIRRCLHYRDGYFVPSLVAEHGLSLLIRVFSEGESHSVLLDAGWSTTGAAYNLKQLEVDPAEIEAAVLSHGHMDHHGGLMNIAHERKEPLPLVVHPDVFLSKRYLVNPDGTTTAFPVLSEPSLQEAGLRVIKSRTSSLIVSGLVMVTGEIVRTTDFEHGMANAYAERKGKIEKDHLLDDQAIVMSVHGKGLVVVTGCSHAGIINTIRYAQVITGIEKVYAIVGGFHLSGPAFEAVIGRTIAELKQINPEVVCPMHCTGWKATTEMAREMPAQFLLNSVGATLLL